jgi:hypothetical protein
VKARCEPESVQVEHDIKLCLFVCLSGKSENTAVINSQNHQPAEPKIAGREQQSDPEYLHGKCDFFFSRKVRT